MKVPTKYTTSVGRSTRPLIGPSGQGGTPEAFGAAVGRSLDGLARNGMALADLVNQQTESANRFEALRRFSAFQTRVQQQVAEAQRSVKGNPGAFADATAARYTQLETEFLDNEIDPAMRDEFSARTAQFGQTVAGQALSFQYEATDRFFRDGVVEGYDAARIAQGQNNTTDAFDLNLQSLFEQIDATGLTPAEKEKLKHETQKGLSAVLYRQEQAAHLAEDNQGGSAISSAQELIDNFSGGTEDEQRVLAQQGESIAVGAVGSIETWKALPARARAALISMASDLGDLPDGVIAAAKSGNLEAISDAIREAGGERRTQEADLVLSSDATIDDDPRYAMLPYEDRLVLREDAMRDFTAAQNEAVEQAKAQNDALINALMVGILDGTAGQADIDSLREIGVMTDFDDIHRAQTELAQRDGDLGAVQAGWQRIANGQTFDPGNEDDKKTLNAMIGEEGINAVRAMDSAYIANTVVPLIRQGGDIPTDVVSTLRGMIRSNNQTQALWALDTLNQFEQASPRAYEMRVDEGDASAVELWRSRKDFYDPTTLLKLVNGGQTQAERQETIALRDEAQAILRDKDLNVIGGLNEAFGFFGGILGIGAQPASSPSLPYAQREMQSDFNRIFEDQFTLYRDANEAKAATLKLMQRVWAVSTVSGSPRLMKFPPEKLYPTVAGSHKWIEDQLRAEIYFPSVEDQRNNTNAQVLIPPDAGFELLADAQTEAEVDLWRRGQGPAPSYTVIKIVDGQPAVIFNEKGLPRRQFFDITAQQRTDEAVWRKQREAQFTMLDLEDALGRAERYSYETGQSIPEDAEGMGIREYMMQEQP